MSRRAIWQSIIVNGRPCLQGSGPLVIMRNDKKHSSSDVIGLIITVVIVWVILNWLAK